MQEFPHQYPASAAAGANGVVRVSSPELPDLETMPPPEFGGEPGYWSPETLLVAAVADCFILSFRAVARASKLDWQHLECKVDGRLDQIDRSTRFTHFDIHAELVHADAADADKARRCLEKAEQVCLITQSLNADTSLQCSITAASPA